MYVFSDVLDEDFLVKLPLQSVSEHAIFWGVAPRSPSNSMLCMFVLCTMQKPSTILLVKFLELPLFGIMYVQLQSYIYVLICT